MRNTKEYTILKNRIEQLKKSCDFKERMNGPTLQQRDKIRSFVLLAHAELEEYFECVALRVLAASECLWKKKQKS